MTENDHFRLIHKTPFLGHLESPKAGQEMGHDVLLLRGAKSPSVSAGQRRLLFLGEDVGSLERGSEESGACRAPVVPPKV